jgi:hypothetical protein
MPQRRAEPLQGRANLCREEHACGFRHRLSLRVPRLPGQLLGAPGNVLDRLKLGALRDRRHPTAERDEAAIELRVALRTRSASDAAIAESRRMASHFQSPAQR